MENIKVNSLLIVTMILILSLFSCVEPVVPLAPDLPKEEEPKDNVEEIEFRVLVYIDEASVKGHLGGSDRVVRSKMDKLFRDVSKFWNESSKGKLDATYRYVVSDMIVYEESSQDSNFRRMVYDEPMDFSKHDVVVLFDCLQDNGETGNGGAAHGGGKDYRSVVTVIAGPNNKLDIFSGNTYKTLAHEFGHYRGVTDMYQYLIDAKDNPVSNESFDAPACNMRWTSDGVWSDYAANCINRAGEYKQIGKHISNFFDSMYPKTIEFNITVDGKTKRGVEINIYGSRAGGSTHGRDIWPEPFVTAQTNSEGIYIVRDVIQHFRPSSSQFKNIPESLPYGRWFGFLVEVKEGASKKYVWIPEWETHMPFFDDEDSFVVNVAL